MAGEIARAFVAIGADVSAAVRGLQQVNGNLGELRRETKRSADAWTGFTGTMARTGLAIQGVKDIARSIRDIGGAIGGLALSADNERVSMEQLAASVQNTGRAMDDGLRQRLEDTVESMRRTTIFSDDQLRQALRVLVIETGDVDEAFRRLPLSADAAAAKQQDLVSTAEAFGKSGEGLQRALRGLGLSYDDAATGSGELAAAQLLAARAGISVQGALKAVGNESIRKRWGIPDPKDTKSAVSDARMLADARARVMGAATRDPSDLQQGWKLVGEEFGMLKKQLGAFFLPVAKGAVAFLSKSLSGVRRMIALFSTDISGPRIGGVRKLWKEIFGTEMPGALKAVVTGFEDIAGRIKTFVEDINSKDDAAVRGAVKKLFEGLKTDITTALGDLGSELDKMGPVGFTLKIAAASVALDKFTGGLVSPESLFSIVKDALQIAWLTTALGKTGPLLKITAGAALAFGLLEIGKVIVNGISSQNIWDKVLGPALAGIVGVTAAFAAGASLPVTLTIGAAIALTFGAVTFGPEIGNIIGGWWADFTKAWEKSRADFITWWNTTSPSWMPKISGPTLSGPTSGFGTPNTGAPGGLAGPSQPSSSSVAASSADIAAAYRRITGNEISSSYLAAVLGQGFSKQQAASLNIFAGDVAGALAGGGGARGFAMGGFGVVTKPTLFMAGERGAEQYRFTPVGASGGGGLAGGVPPISIVINGDVDSRSRVSELGREIEVRTARLLGLAAV